MPVLFFRYCLRLVGRTNYCDDTSSNPAVFIYVINQITDLNDQINKFVFAKKIVASVIWDHRDNCLLSWHRKRGHLIWRSTFGNLLILINRNTSRESPQMSACGLKMWLWVRERERVFVWGRYQNVNREIEIERERVNRKR